MILRFAIVIITLAFIGCGTTSRRAPGTVEAVKLEIEERAREYLVYTPKSLQGDSRKRALVVVLHGGGGTARQIMRETGESFFRLAEKDGFYVVFPQAVNKMWDFGAGKISTSLKERINDRSYFEAVLDDVTVDLPIDTRRIFATGISRGGQASYYLACEFPGRIRAIAPVAMPMPVFMADSCRNGPPVGVAIMNGTADPLVPYDGGTITIGKNQRDEVLATTETVALWNKRNGCSQALQKKSIVDSAQDGMHVEITERRGCSGAAVLLYRIVGGGHTWPSGNQYLPAFVIGRVNKDIDGAKVAWTFFREFR